MVIGNGMLAQAFKDYEYDDKIIIFASGVSNSKEHDEKNFEREANLLRQTIANNPEKLIIYFSTCSIEDDSLKTSKYVLHKLKMETLIKKNHSRFHIFRLSQVVGITNSPTLVNFLFDAVSKHKLLQINAFSTRNLIAVKDIFIIVDYLIKNKKYVNEIVNIATPNNSYVINILFTIETIIGKEAQYELVERGSKQNIDISKIKALNIDFNIFQTTYEYDILSTYYYQKFIV